MRLINVFTNKYGVARSLIALAGLVTLMLTPPQYYFTKIFFEKGSSLGEPSVLPNLFYLLGEDNLYVSVAISIIVLLWVISGYLPQISGILHAWVQFSFFHGSMIIEGGDQVGQINTILLIPVCLFDKRINHWHTKEYFTYTRPVWLEYFCYSCIVIIQFQMCTLYFFSSVEKFKVDEWLNGSAYYYWFNNKPFGASEPIKFLFDFFINSKYFSPVITWSVLVLESILFAGFFMNSANKKKLFYLGVCFHFMIVVVHGLNSFFLYMAGGLILYLLPPGKNFNFAGLFAFFKRIINKKLRLLQLKEVVIKTANPS
jgi:antimicrobial peptide system SdpB family protein